MSERLALDLFAHPFSSYSWKVLIALYERGIAFNYRMMEDEGNGAALKAAWPVGKFPLLVDEGRPVAESSIIIETLDDARFGDAPRMIPEDRAQALEVRFMDRVFDNHVMSPMQAIVNEYIFDRSNPDRARIGRAEGALDTVYDWLEARLDADGWAAGERFSLADCAAAPALFYADWVREIGERPRLKAYRARLLARPSVNRCVEDARPYRGYFPPGAPDRD